MDTHILNNIPLRIDIAALAHELRISDRRSEMDELTRMIAEAETVGRPKAMYRVSPIEMRDDRSVMVDGITLTSRVLRVNLDGLHRVFPFAATCGTELEEWSADVGDRILHRYWADAIKEKVLRIAIEFMDEHLAEHYRPGPVSHMNPGSLADWPLKQQRALFALLGDPQEAIGVRLTDSMLMVPIKSVSGIMFATEETFASCQLCPMERCSNRRAPYDRALYEQKYKAGVS
jgi:hypothetical protein